jgi:hypothetical protein
MINKDKKKKMPDEIEAFLDSYAKLCKKHKLRLAFIPKQVLKPDNTYSLAIEVVVTKL